MTEANQTHERAASARPCVLVAIDFSEDAQAALLWACRHVARADVELVLLHVIHDPASSPGFYRKAKGSLFRPMHAVAESMMAGFLEDFAERHPEFDWVADLTPQFVPGLPPSRIVEIAKARNAQLVVLGSRGLTGWPQRLMGSTCSRVVERAPMPVVVVKSKDFETLDRKARKRREKQRRKEARNLRTQPNVEVPVEPDDDDD